MKKKTLYFRGLVVPHTLNTAELNGQKALLDSSNQPLIGFVSQFVQAYP
jgi:hypothetical protein